MKKLYQLAFLTLFGLGTFQTQGQILISAMMPNTYQTDSMYEYVQLIATENINFASTPYSVVVLNNGTATVKGWAHGLSISYKFNLTNGSVNRGDVFYVGGSGKRIDGSGSTDISSLTWIRAINTATTAGDGFGNANASGVFGNVGANADGAAVFAGTTVDSTSMPIDALFFGYSVGSAYSAGPPEKGYKVPTNDHYNSSLGLFGVSGNSYMTTVRNAADTLLSYSGTYDTILNSWTVGRTPVYVVLNSTSPISAINTNITLVGTPVGIQGGQELSTVTVYPNPSDGIFTISNPSGGNILVEVFDMLGSITYRWTGAETTHQANLSTRPKGVYFVQVTKPESGSKTVRKLVLK